jgi:hypothetical protein
MSLIIQPIIEGSGELDSMRILLNRIALTFFQIDYVDVLKPITCNGKQTLLKRLDDDLLLAAQKLKQRGGGAVLVLLDCDEQCPAQEAPKLLARVQENVSHLSSSVVMANRMFENWFIAGANSIQKLHAPVIPTDPESVMGAKAWLSRHMGGDNYKPGKHQAAFTTEFDLHLARANAPSFDKLCRDLEKMFAQLEV